MKKTIASLAMIALCASMAPAAQAGLIKKAIVGAGVVGAAAAVHAKAKQGHEGKADAAAGAAAPAPSAPDAPGAASAAAAPTPTAKPDANAIIDKGAAKAKATTAKVKDWIAKKKAEREARKAEQTQPTGPTVAPMAGGKVVPAQ